MAAFLLPAEVDRFVEDQEFSTNLAVIANRRNYVELNAHIRTGQ